MNTITIAVLLVCATMAYASTLPSGDIRGTAVEPLPDAAAEEILQGDENRYYGGGRGGGHYGGGHYGGGHYGYNRGGGGYYRGGGGYYRRHWGK